jgi:hypothetical protein
VELGREVATAATVWSRRGVEAYVMVSPSNATLVNGRTATDDALGKESLSAAGAEGFREERLYSPGARTLGQSVCVPRRLEGRTYASIT